MGLQVELWEEVLVKETYPDNSFASQSRDRSKHVNGSKVTEPNQGSKPSVTKNVTSFPMPIQNQQDEKVEWTIDQYFVDPIRIGKIDEEDELSYNKRKETMDLQLLTLQETVHNDLAYKWAPTDHNRLVRSTGDLVSGVGRKVVSDDFLKLGKQFNEENIPLDGRCVLITPDMLMDLLTDPDVKKQNTLGATVQKDGTLGQYGGFTFYMRSTSVWYSWNAGSPTRIAPGSVMPGDETHVSIAWHKSWVNRALGEIHAKDLESAGYYGRVLECAVRAGGSKRFHTEKGVFGLVKNQV